jgi:hypothetical protein
LVGIVLRLGHPLGQQLGLFPSGRSCLCHRKSLVNQHAKWLKTSKTIPWRKPIAPALRYWPLASASRPKSSCTLARCDQARHQSSMAAYIDGARARESAEFHNRDALERAARIKLPE